MPLKQVNTLTSLDYSNDGSRFNVYATTALPADPTLCIFCCDPILTPFNVRRAGQELLHGRKQFFPCDPTYYAPTYVDGNSFGWLLPSAAADCPQCHFLIAQKAEPPLLDWSSQPYPCPPVKPPQPQVYQAYTTLYGIGPGQSPDPALIASFTFDNTRNAIALAKAYKPYRIYLIDVLYCGEGMAPPQPAPGFLIDYSSGVKNPFEPPVCFEYSPTEGGYDILFYYAVLYEP